MNAGPSEAQPKAEPPPAGVGKARRALIGLAVAAASLAGAYATGRVQGKLATDAAERRTSEVAEEKRRASGEFDAQRDRALRLEARRRLHLALLSAEERNFGIAQGHLDKAATLLERTSGEPKLDALAAEIKNEKLAASDDLGGVRQKLVGWARDFDAALPPAEP